MMDTIICAIGIAIVPCVAIFIIKVLLNNDFMQGYRNSKFLDELEEDDSFETFKTNIQKVGL